MPTFEIKNSTALVTGANRGIGRAYVEALVAGGASKVYAAARNADSVADLVQQHPGLVEALELDITDAAEIAAATQKAADVNLLINNAGVATAGPILGSEDTDAMRFDVEVNLFGTTNMLRAFAPVITANRGAIVILNSVVSFTNFPIFGGYSVSKAALESVTSGVRQELEPAGVLVVGVYPGPIETDMSRPLDMEKEPPAVVPAETFAALAAGRTHVLPDKYSKDFVRDFAREQSLAVAV